MSEGRPVTIITVDEDEKLNLDVAALESVLNQPELKDRPVCLLPIAGTFFSLSISLLISASRPVCLLPIAGAFWLFHDLSFDILLLRCFSQGQVLLT